MTLEQQNEVLCAYIEHGGDLRAATREAQERGVPFAYGAISNFIKRNPRAVKLTQKFFDEEYVKHNYRRLESVGAAKVQEFIEIASERLGQLAQAYADATLSAQSDKDALRLGYLSNGLRDLTKAVQSMTYIAVRFRDGLHAKQAPTVDMSQKVEQKYDFTRALPHGGYDALAKHIQRLKENERFRNLETAQPGGNGDSA